MSDLSLWSSICSLFSLDYKPSHHLSLFAPISSFLAKPASLFSSLFSSFFFRSTTPKSTSSPSKSITSPSKAPSTPDDVQLFPQIILDLRLTASPSALSDTKTATPCATDPTATLHQVHNAGGELVGFDLADSGMQSSYMLQLQPQLQYQPQFVAPQVFPAVDSATDPGDFLNKLDELEVYIAQMRNRLSAAAAAAASTTSSSSSPSSSASPSVATSQTSADDLYHALPAFSLDPNAPRVVRRRNERQNMYSAAPYVRPSSASASAYGHQHLPQQQQQQPSFVVPEDLSSSASWSSPAEFADQESPSTISAVESSYSFAPAPAINDPVEQFTHHHDFVDLQGKESSFDDPFSALDLVHQHGHQQSQTQYANSGLLVQPFVAMHNNSLDDQQMFMHQHQYVGQPPVSMHIASPSSSISSPQTSTGSSSSANSPASSNSSPSSSPPKSHAGVASPDQSIMMGSDTNSSPMHMNSSSQPTFQCPHCPSKFRIKGYLTRHLKKHAMNKAYTCPFYDPTSPSPCHSTGGFSRRDTYKTHLKSRHFVYPTGTRSDQRAGMRGWCAACGVMFDCNENWVENHVEGGECGAFQSVPMYA
ncbi:hypothetical protein BZA70DRAFT_95823 [Myxozyma melibiosi]|uniref:C2H2-type domain-containing protein n=1 Tax=Myxozyma melibiosi TaxID=54550 RepID=A0ABR1EZ07_9ASCO